MRDRRPAFLLVLFAVLAARPVWSETQSPPCVGTEIASDSRYIVNNVVADVKDFLAAPLYAGELLRKREFYYTLLGTGAVLGTAFALDNTVRARVSKIGDGEAANLETAGESMAWGATGMLYAWGFYSDDAKAREYALTGVESTGIGSLVTIGLKQAFGRSRPSQGKGAFHFFDDGESFVSGAATPPFALAAALSEYSDNAWYVAAPAYAAAVAVGLGRMGQDAHWTSDVVGSALLGIGTTELLLYLHRQHAEHPSRLWIFPIGTQGSTGVQVGFEW